MAQKFLNGIVSTGNILPSSDSTYDLGHGSYRWANLNVDAISTTSTFVAGGTIALNSSISTLNKAQTSYISFATRNTSGSETLMDLTNVGSATFAGSITTETGGSVFGGSGGIPIYARSTGTVSYMQFQTSSTGSNGSSDGLTIGVNGSTAYIWNRENTTLHLGTNDTSALALDSSQNATFAGTVKAYGNSDTTPAFEMYSDSNHGMRILHRSTDGDFSFERRLSGTNTEFLRIGRANGNATFAGDIAMVQTSGNNTLTIDSSGGGNPVIYYKDTSRTWGQFLSN